MSGTKFIVYIVFLAVMLVSSLAEASRGRGNTEEKPPQIYKEKAIKMLNSLAADDIANEISPFTKKQQKELKELLKEKDEFLYDQPDTLTVINKPISVSLQERKVIDIKLGHTYTTTVVFTDALGNPWTVETLTDMSNSEVVAMHKPAPHILSFRPKKKSGQTNLPIKLAGEQSPLMLFFDINEKEVFFNADVKVDGLGDHQRSQQKASMQKYMKGEYVPPKLNAEPAKEQMLQFLTPDNYMRRELKNGHGERVDPRDFMAWTHNGKLYIMTPHFHYSPQPQDISAASDGRHRLFEYNNTSVVLMKMNSQIVMLHVQ